MLEINNSKIDIFFQNKTESDADLDTVTIEH